MALALFVLVQTLATAFGGAFLWRRHQAMRAEIETLRRSLQARAAVAKPRVVGAGLPSEAAGPPRAVGEAPLERAHRRWGLAQPALDAARAASPDTIRGAALAFAATAPALTLLFGANAAIVCASGVLIAAILMMTALRMEWSMTGWFALAGGVVWGALAFAVGAAASEPLLFAVSFATLALSALAHARLRRARLGWLVLACAAGAALALAMQTGVVGPAGASLALIVAGAAFVGASMLRLEPLLVGAFVVAGASLFVLSGERVAAIWFTPAAAWAGALFLGVAAVRVPQLGGRGAVVAGLGALSAIGATYLVHASGHGLADTRAAAAVFAAIAIALGLIIAAAWQRAPGGESQLKLTLWTLALAGLYAALAASDLAAPAPLAATLAALVAVGVLALNTRFAAMAWRACAVGALVACAAHASSAAAMLLAETPRWPGEALIGLGLAAPALLTAIAARLAQHTKESFTAAAAEALTFMLAIASANLALRYGCAGGAVMLAPISFVEACGHIAIWLFAGLLIGSRVKRGARGLRRTFTSALTLAAALASLAAALFWFGPFWSERAETAPAWLSHEPAGFLLLFIGLGAHWVYWRGRRDEWWTRASFALSGAMGAGFVILFAFDVFDGTAARAIVIALATAAAVGVNFAPGVTLGGEAEHEARRAQLPQQA